MGTIVRESRVIVGVVVDTTVGDSESVAVGDIAGGNVLVPAGSSVTSLAWHASVDGETFVPIHNSDGAVTQAVAAGRAYALPEELFGCLEIRAVSNAAGTINLSLKA